MEKIEIHELIAKYYHAVDTKNTSAWLELWSSDGILRNGDHVAEGIKELTKFADEHITDPKKHTRHMATNIYVVSDGKIATMINYMLVIDSSNQNAQHASAICSSKLEKIDGQWKLKLHVFNTDTSFDFSKI